MHDPSYAFLKQLLTTPSPSGYEQRIQEVVRTWARSFADEVTTVDTMTVEPTCTELRNGLFTSPGLDDKVGVWTVMETLRLLHGKRLNAAVFCVSTVQEEIGLRGAATSAYGIHPTVGIAVDVCHATDTPGNEKKQIGDAKLSAGPVVFRGPNINPHVHDRLIAAAKAEEIAVQVRGNPQATGTDGNAIQLARAGPPP